MSLSSDRKWEEKKLFTGEIYWGKTLFIHSYSHLSCYHALKMGKSMAPKIYSHTLYIFLFTLCSSVESFLIQILHRRTFIGHNFQIFIPPDQKDSVHCVKRSNVEIEAHPCAWNKAIADGVFKEISCLACIVAQLLLSNGKGGHPVKFQTVCTH